MFIPISIVVAVLLRAVNDIALPKIFEIELKKRGKKLKEEKRSIFTILRRYIIDCIPFVNILSIIAHLFADVILIVFYDKAIDRYSDTYSAEYIKSEYEKNESNKKDIMDALTLDGASEEEIKHEMKAIKTQVGKPEKGSSIITYPDFNEKDYEWACAYEEASNFIDSLFADVTLSKKDKYEIINEMISYIKKSNIDKVKTSDLGKEIDDISRARNEEVSNKVLEIINSHL